MNQIEQLVLMLHELGVPTWLDIDDLGAVPTEQEIRHILKDPETASAVVWITPDVSKSPIIQKVEIPQILKRGRDDRKFFIVAVAAEGLGYDEASEVADPANLLSSLARWNMEKLDHGSDLFRISEVVLENRLESLATRATSREDISISMRTRTGPVSDRCHLDIDWTHRFASAYPSQSEWETELLPALRCVRDRLASKFAPNRIVISGNAHLPVAIALGRTFTSTGQMRVDWKQYFPTRDIETWSISAKPGDAPLIATVRPAATEAEDYAVLVSVTTDVEPAVANSIGAPNKFRVTCNIAPNGGRQVTLGTDTAIDLAKKITDQMRSIPKKYGCHGTAHLFMAGPAGLAFLVGQLSNSLGPIQTYEHIDDGAIGRYSPSVLLGSTS